MVNWFRQDDSGSFMWPGFGDNIRVLKWVIDRVNGRVGAKETAIGNLPNIEDLDMSGLSISRENLERLFSINKAEWDAEVSDGEQFFAKFGERMPEELMDQFRGLKERLKGKV